jgi:hypothetical protein
MTHFHLFATTFAFLTTVSEALRFYRMNMYFATKQGALMSTAFLLLLLMLLPMSDQTTVGLLILVLPFFTWSMYRWRNHFNDFYVYLLTK